MVKKNNKISRKMQKVIFVILFFVLFSTLLSSILVINRMKNVSKPILSAKIPVEFIIGDVIGFNVDNSSLIFGIIPVGNSANRDLTLDTYVKDVNVKILFSDSIKEYVMVNENDFILPANTNKTLTFSLFNTHMLDMDNYTGEVVIYYYEVK